MPSPFAITLNSINLDLDPRRHGEYVFTVTSMIARPVSAKTRITPQDSSHESWFTIVDGPHRTLGAKTTEQIRVQIDVPASVPSGQYSFRLDVISVEDPDEMFTVGPSVSFKLNEAPPAPKPRPWLLMAILAAVLVLLLGSLAWWMLHKRPEPVVVSPAPKGPAVPENDCKPGFTWRLAGPNDHVCVTPAVRKETEQENAAATGRVQPGGGAYGPDTCLQGFVWRDAFPGDHVCVTGDIRQRAAIDNSQAAERRVAVPPTVAQGDHMRPGEVLNPDQAISSADGRYTLKYQSDGNLVLYRNGDARALWASNTNGKPAGVCIMQGDGNLVVYDPGNHPVWASGTWHDAGSHLLVQNDGNVVIYRPDNTAAWATNTVQ